MRFVKFIVIALLVAGCAGAAAIWYQKSNRKSDAVFRTAAAQRTDLLVTISATGTLEPEEVVDVGAQVAGRIISFGVDKAGKPIDYNSVVAANSVLAKIDDTLYQADLDSAQAQVASAKAGVTRAEADLGQMQAKAYQTERDWERAKKLGPSDALAQVDYDAYQSAYEVAKANVGVGRAAVDQAKTAVIQAEAALKRAQQNLGYCTIVAPVDGTVIARRVNIGQTVVSSLSAPSLFLLAKDLNRMQVWVAVNEADVGSITAGQPVSFTVDARPGMAFRGAVNKVRLNAQTTSNVVTYTVEVTTDNQSGALLPYATANVAFEVARKENALVVPNAALRWNPTSTDQISPDSRTALQSSAADEPTTKPTTHATNAPGSHRTGSGAARRATVWVQDGQFAKPITIRAGLSDGLNTEVVSGEVPEDAQVIIGETQPSTASPSGASDMKNPFMPQMPGRGGGRGGAGGGSGGGRR